MNGRSPEDLHRGSGGGAHPAEGQVAGGPDHGASVVGGEDRAADVVGAGALYFRKISFQQEIR